MTDKHAKVSVLHELSAECPECKSHLWELIINGTVLKELDDIFAIQCPCGYRVEFREEG